jgi:inorganic pyrophosphatase
MEDLWKTLETGPEPPEIVYAIVEIPKGSRNKYRYDVGQKAFFLDKVLFTPFHYSTDYGIIPQTMYDDGRPLDILVLMDQPTFPGCIIEARPVGLLKMMDSGAYDDKILAVPAKDHKYANIQNVKDVLPDTLNELARFYQHYKEAEKRDIKVVGWEGAETAKRAIIHSMKIYGRKI